MNKANRAQQANRERAFHALIKENPDKAFPRSYQFALTKLHSYYEHN